MQQKLRVLKMYQNLIFSYDFPFKGLNLFVVFQFLGRIGKTCRDRVAYIMGTRKELVQITVKLTIISEVSGVVVYLNDCQPKEVIVYVMFVAVLIVVLTLFYNGNLKSGYLLLIRSLCTILGFLTGFLYDC